MGSFESQSFSQDQLRSALLFAEEAADSVQVALRNNFGQADYETKDGDDRSWVTKWDTWAQERIVERLKCFSTDVGFRCEEDGLDTASDVYWTVDSIDGTSGFVRGVDVCTTMLSLVDHDQPVVALINDFIRGKTYTAVSGKGAWMHKLAGSQPEKLSVSDRHLAIAHVEVYCEATSITAQKLKRDISVSGAFLLQNMAEGHTLTSVARGATEALVCKDSPYATDWDTAPGVLLVHEAGGVVRNLDQEGFRLSDRDFIASNQTVFEALRKIVSA